MRRTWIRARSIWLQPDPGEPRMELIIKLAQDPQLREAIKSVGAHPRRILLRIRDQTPVGRVTELDAACIREYARLPGRTPYEKAGASQRLLAVQRQASFDTLENRVACWTLDELRRRSQQWRQRHIGSRALGGERARQVAHLARIAADIRHTEHFTNIAHGSLVHPVVANYPLQMEARYRCVYNAYQQLLRYRRIMDEAWTWRRPLWSDAVRQLIACTLVTRMGTPLAESAPYYRTEGERGRWIAAPSGPGPYQTVHGPMYVIDAHDAEQSGSTWHSGMQASWAPYIGMLGPDSILWWPKSDSVVVVWSQLWSGASTGFQAQVDAAAQALQRFTDGVSFIASTRITVAGILLSTDAYDRSVAQVTNQRGGRTVVGITLPMAIDTTDKTLFENIARDLSAGLELAIEEVCR